MTGVDTTNRTNDGHAVVSLDSPVSRGERWPV